VTATVTRPDRVRLAGQRQQSLALVHFRLMLVMLLFLGVVGVIALRLLWISLFAGAGPSTPAADGLLPARGDIVDRNGVPLARTIQSWSIGLHPRKLVNDPMEVAKKLAAVMPEHSVAEYYAMLKSPKSFVYLRRRATPELVAEVNAIGEPGIALAQEPERLYPQTTLAAHVLGWTDIDGRGVFGMEKVLNNRLLDASKRGQPVALSIDSRVQAAMEAELGAAVQKFTAAGGEGLVLDVRTGEVVAMASFPTFNPNDPGATPIDALKNNTTQSVYELGSTFKAITIANAIDTGVVTSMTKKYDATAPLQIGRYKIHDDHAENRWLNVPEMMVQSGLKTRPIFVPIVGDFYKGLAVTVALQPQQMKPGTTPQALQRCFEQHYAEGVGTAGENEHVGGSVALGQRLARLLAGEQHAGILRRQLLELRATTDDHFAAG